MAGREQHAAAAAVAAIAVLAAANHAHAYAHAQTVSLSDGRNLALYCKGEGAPTVILDSGLGMDGSVWTAVQAEVSRARRVCAFDRAGYGASDEGPAPRDSTHIVADLREALARAGVPGPYVLVGHSAGGYDMRLFALQRPADVVGLVLVDPSIDGNEAPLRAVSPAFGAMQDEFEATFGRCIRAVAADEMSPTHPLFAQCGSPDPASPMGRPSLARTVVAEQAALDDDSEQVLAAEGGRGYGDLPLIVLTAGAPFGPETPVPAAEREAMHQVVRAQHADIAARSTRGEQRIIEGAPHIIHIVRPEVVAGAVQDVIERADRP